jgi:hypothetical protein
VVAVLAGTATWFALARTGASPSDILGTWWQAAEGPAPEPRSGPFDIYAHFVPIMAYAAQALRTGGGLFWTPLQNCGQPFAAYNGLLYPLHWLPVIFGVDAGLRLLIAAHLLLGGTGAYLLGRELGARRSAALLGAVAFQLGNAAAHTASWTPLVLEPLMWFPAALLCVERLLRAPSARWTVALGAACGMALLPAWPQLVWFLYQLIALRVLWALVIERPTRPFASFGAVVAGLALGPLLDGVQLFPALEVARDSVRRLTLSAPEINLARPFTFDHFRTNLSAGVTFGQPLTVIPFLLASLALVRRERRSTASFYLAAGLLYFVLGLGPETRLFDWYLALPGGRLFREPMRFIWVTGFCLSVLVALGSEALAAAVAQPGARRRWTVPLLALGTLGALQAISFMGLRPLELGIGLLGVGIVVAAATRLRRLPVLGLMGAAFAASVLLVPAYTLYNLYPSSASLRRHEALFERLRAKTAPSWRTYIVADNLQLNRFALMEKSASLFGVPDIRDYEPQTAWRFAEFMVMMRESMPMRTLNAYYYALRGWMPPQFNRNLLDLAAGRYVVVDADSDGVAHVLTPSPPEIDRDGDVRVYENASALPRALWVPRVQVIPQLDVMLRRLALRWVDPWDTALVETPPASGFLGEPREVDAGRGTVSFARDDPESLAIDVDAPRRGFLLLADQYRDGWHATVDGVAAPIERANYVFRLVEVPAGRSRVEFRYDPPGLRLGALVSALALLVAGGTLWLTRPRRAETRAPGGSTP